jgi:hypothetical protein
MSYRYTDEKYKEFLTRALEYMEKNPNATRKAISDYAGVHIGTLERFEKEGKIKLPPPMTSQQRRKRTNWANTLGQLSGRRS